VCSHGSFCRGAHWSARAVLAIRSFGSLEPGWDSHDAPPPSKAAIDQSTQFIAVCASEELEPVNIAPSVMGGVGITFEANDREAYVELSNNGDTYMMRTDQSTEDINPIVDRVPANERAFLDALCITRALSYE